MYLANCHKIIQSPRLRYNSEQDLWVVRHVTKEDFVATSKAPEESYLLGSHLWTIQNDSRACSPTGVIAILDLKFKIFQFQSDLDLDLWFKIQNISVSIPGSKIQNLLISDLLVHLDLTCVQSSHRVCLFQRRLCSDGQKVGSCCWQSKSKFVCFCVCVCLC